MKDMCTAYWIISPFSTKCNKIRISIHKPENLIGTSGIASGSGPI